MRDDSEIERLRDRVAMLEAELDARSDSRAMMRTVLETVPAIVLRISLDGTIEFVNRILPAYEAHPPVGQSIYAFAPVDQHEVMRHAIETAQRTLEVISYESIALAPDGSRDWYWTVVGPILRESTLVGQTLICTNITGVKAAERALIESHERLAAALDAGNVGVWRWSSVRDLVEWDDKLCAMFGLSPEQAPRTRAGFLALVSDDQRDALSAHIDRALSSGIYLDFELRADLPGEVRWFVIKGGGLRDASGSVSGLIGGVVDDTERRRLVEQVREAQKLDALGQLSAGVAHNFNNMLGAIVPALEIAAREAGALSPILNDAKDTAMRSAELVKQLLQFSRRGPAHVPRPEALETVLSRAYALCRGTFAREITLTQRGFETASKVSVDGPHMEQAILNLLLNARDALEGVSASRARIEVSVDEVTSTGAAPSELTLRFRDTGSGMDEATRRRVFEPFFTTKPIGRGTGLGLSTAWATVRAHRGSLTCDSTPGVGTTFSLSLPIVGAVARARISPPEVASEPGRGELVLVIDDEHSLRRTLAALLSASGYRVVTAASGEAGVSAFRDERADLVILDQSMPGQPPSVTLSQLRCLAPAVPIISFSGLGDTLPEATLHLQKPVAAETLLAAIRTAMTAL